MSLSELFMQARSTNLLWEGQNIHSLIDLNTAASRLSVTFLDFAAEPAQGLKFKIRGGSMRVGDVVARELVLWVDSAPSFTEIDIAWSGTPGSSLKVWNVWKDHLDVEHAWLNNAAMQVKSISKTDLMLRCSDGVGPPDFADLTAILTQR